MTSEIIYQNSAHRDYDHSQDDYYLVRIPGTYPGEEWRIITPRNTGDDNLYFQYPHGKGPTREQAMFFAREYSIYHPDTPVRVERHTLTPRSAESLMTFTPDTFEERQ